MTQIGMKIVLIDGQQLADLMIEHGVGVSEVATYTVKRADEDYFDDASPGAPLAGKALGA